MEKLSLWSLTLCAFWGFCSVRDHPQYAQYFKISFDALEKSSSPPPTYKKNPQICFPAGCHLRTYVKLPITAPPSNLKDYESSIHTSIFLYHFSLSPFLVVVIFILFFLRITLIQEKILTCFLFLKKNN